MTIYFIYCEFFLLINARALCQCDLENVNHVDCSDSMQMCASKLKIKQHDNRFSVGRNKAAVVCPIVTFFFSPFICVFPYRRRACTVAS